MPKKHTPTQKNSHMQQQQQHKHLYLWNYQWLYPLSSHLCMGRMGIHLVLDIFSSSVSSLVLFVSLYVLLVLNSCCRILGLTALNSLLQYVNWLVWEVCSVN